MAIDSTLGKEIPRKKALKLNLNFDFVYLQIPTNNSLPPKLPLSQDYFNR